MQENLNLVDNYKAVAIKALNKTKEVKRAAELMGISERTLHRWKIEFDIYWCDKELMFKTKN